MSRKRQRTSVLDLDNEPTPYGSVDPVESIQGFKIYDKRTPRKGKWTPKSFTFKELVDTLYPTYTLQESYRPEAGQAGGENPINSVVGSQTWYCEAVNPLTVMFPRLWLKNIYMKCLHEINPLTARIPSATTGTDLGYPASDNFDSRLLPDLHVYNVKKEYKIQNTGTTLANVKIIEFLCKESNTHPNGPLTFLEEDLLERKHVPNTDTVSYAPLHTQAESIYDVRHKPQWSKGETAKWFTKVRETNYDVQPGSFVVHKIYYPGCTIQAKDLLQYDDANAESADDHYWIKGVSRAIVFNTRGQVGFVTDVGDAGTEEGKMVTTISQWNIETHQQATFRCPLKLKRSQTQRAYMSTAWSWSADTTKYQTMDYTAAANSYIKVYPGQATAPATLGDNDT